MSTSPSDTTGRGISSLRVLLAGAVVFSHTFPLGGFGPDLWARITNTDTIGGMAVCSFFLLSGWLIGASAERSDTLTYLGNRARRLLPGFWASLLVVAAVTTILRPSLGAHATAYVLGNAALQIRYFDIGDLLLVCHTRGLLMDPSGHSRLKRSAICSSSRSSDLGGHLQWRSDWPGALR